MNTSAKFVLFWIVASGCAPDLTLSAPKQVRPTTDNSTATVYRYVNDEGRTVFVDDLSLVPADRAASTDVLTLDHISLNRQLGNDLDAQLRTQHEMLSQTPFCERAREVSSQSRWKQVWQEQGHLIAIGGLIVLVLLMTPWMIKLVPVPQWTRTLMFVLPILVLLGGLTHVAVTTSRTMRHVNETVTLCDPGSVNADGGERAHRLSAIQTLRQRMQGQLGKRMAHADAAISTELGDSRSDQR